MFTDSMFELPVCCLFHVSFVLVFMLGYLSFSVDTLCDGVLMSKIVLSKVWFNLSYWFTVCLGPSSLASS